MIQRRRELPLDQRLETIEAWIEAQPSRWELMPKPNVYYAVHVIGGNAAQIGGGYNGIVYEPNPITLSRKYDPNTDTVYPAGLGYGILYADGIAMPGYVLIRHNCVGYPRTVTNDHGAARAVGTTAIPYPAVGSDPAGSLVAYVFDGI